jgi:hypothetical protein
MSLGTRLASLTNFRGDVVIKGEGYDMTMRTNGADIFLTAAVTIFGETLPDVDLCAKGECILGIVRGPATTQLNFAKDADSPYADNTKIRVYIARKGDQVYVTAKSNSAITQGHLIQADGGFFIDFAYTDGTENTDTLESVYGQALEAVSAASGTEKIFTALVM